MVKASASGGEDPGFKSCLRRDISGLGLVGPVSIYCDWVRLNVWSATSVSMWQHVKKLSEQIRRWDTLACCWDVKQPTNKQTWTQLFACWLLNVPATGECISGTDLLRQFCVLPHWDRSCRSNVLPHPVTVYWHRADQSQCWPYNARRLAGQPLECQFLSHWYDSTPKKSRRKWDSNPGSSTLEAVALH